MKQGKKLLASVAPLNDGGFTSMSKLVTSVAQRINNPRTVTGIPTCFPSLDYFTCGLQRGDLIVVAGRPSMGKSNFVRNIALHVAILNDLPVAIMENDIGDVILATQLISSVAKINLHNLFNGGIDGEALERFTSAVEVVKNAPIHCSSLTPLSVQELGEQLRNLRQRVGDLGMVVIDCLPALNFSSAKMNSEDAIEIAYISRHLKALALELNVCIFVLSQVDREVENRRNKRPRISDLPAKAAIANAADLILMVYRDEVYNPESEEKGSAQIIVARNRNGAIGSIDLKFDGRYGNFEEIHQG